MATLMNAWMAALRNEGACESNITFQRAGDDYRQNEGVLCTVHFGGSLTSIEMPFKTIIHHLLST